MWILAGIVAAVLLGTVAWRLASRHTVPCPVWLRWLVELENPFTRTARSTVIIQHLDLLPGMAVLDAGCGPGRVTLPLARQLGEQGEMVAMDIQAGMIQRAQDRARAEGLKNIRFLRAGLGEGKLGRNQFDRAVLVSVLGEIPDREAALREIFGALKPGGILSVTETIFDPHFQRRATVAKLAVEIGFRQKDFYGNRVAFTLNLEKPRDE